MSIRNILKLQNEFREYCERESKAAAIRTVAFTMIITGILMKWAPHWASPSQETIQQCDSIGLGMILGGSLSFLYSIFLKRKGNNQ